MTTVSCLSRIEMVCERPRELAGFYQEAFGFLESDRVKNRATGIRRNVRMWLGEQEIALVGVEPPGRSYQSNIAGWNPLFQHIAIVVSDMSIAYDRLSAIPGWIPISIGGPQHLPPTSGGVTAFKFRDPEGHPLELIAFAAHAIPTQWQKTSVGICLGIDHSAISVANSTNSIAFYQRLGLNRSGGSLNVGPEQARLDDVANAVVEVTALTPTQSTPHLELLCYLGEFDRNVKQSANDVIATRLVFTVENHAAFDLLVAQNADNLVPGSATYEGSARRALLRDPDGHLICLETEEIIMP